MSIFRVIAGYTYGHADIVRRAMSKKKADVLQAERESFLEGAQKNGVSADVAEQLFDDMASFANYAFNKSHAAAYAVISYRTAYLKHHFPCEFMSALMTSVLGNFTKLAEYISECEKYGIHVLPPDINESRMVFHPKDGNIVFGLLALKNVGKQFIESIIRERAGQPFVNFEDFIKRMVPYDLNKRMVEALIKAGAFDSLGEYRSRLLASFETLIERIQQKDRNNIAGQLDMFSAIPEAQNLSPQFEYPAIPEFSLKEKLMLEKECSGMYFSGHLLDSYDLHVKYLSPRGIAEVVQSEALQNKEAVSVAGIVSSVTVKTTRKNEKMAFFTVEDRYGEIECIAFPTQLKQFSHWLRTDAPLYVQGNLSLRDGEEEAPKILVSHVMELMENGKFEGTSPKQAPTTVQNHVSDTQKTVSRTGNTPPTKVFLRVPDLQCREYKKARNLVDIFEGGARVVFYDTSTSRYLPYDHGLDATEFVLNELITILGRENVVPRS